VTWLLDTNTLVYILNGEARIRARANEAGRAGRVVTSIVVVAELLYGVERSSRREPTAGISRRSWSRSKLRR
jgi:predicted nucleic acid-binding protein